MGKISLLSSRHHSSFGLPLTFVAPSSALLVFLAVLAISRLLTGKGTDSKSSHLAQSWACCICLYNLAMWIPFPSLCFLFPTSFAYISWTFWISLVLCMLHCGFISLLPMCLPLGDLTSLPQLNRRTCMTTLKFRSIPYVKTQLLEPSAGSFILFFQIIWGFLFYIRACIRRNKPECQKK